MRQRLLELQARPSPRTPPRSKCAAQPAHQATTMARSPPAAPTVSTAVLPEPLAWLVKLEYSLGTATCASVSSRTFIGTHQLPRPTYPCRALRCCQQEVLPGGRRCAVIALLAVWLPCLSSFWVCVHSLAACMHLLAFAITYFLALHLFSPAAAFCVEGDKKICCSQTAIPGTCQAGTGTTSTSNMCCPDREILSSMGAAASGQCSRSVLVELPRPCPAIDMKLCAPVLPLLQRCASWRKASSGAAPQPCPARSWRAPSTASAATPRTVSVGETRGVGGAKQRLLPPATCGALIRA